MNPPEAQKTLKEESNKYLSGVQQWLTEFKNTVCNFLTSDSKRCLLVETESTQSCVIRILQALGELKQDSQHREVLEKYLASENQTFLRWKRFTEVVAPLEKLPKLTELLLCEFKISEKLTENDGVVLKKIVSQLKLSASKKVIFVVCEVGVLNKYLEAFELRESLKINEFRKKVTAWFTADDKEALWNSASCGRVNDVTELLKNGVNVNSVCGPNGSTALHVASEKGHRDIILTLLRNGASNSHNDYKETPLHLAAQHGHTDVLIVLLENNVDVDVRNVRGCTALHYAATQGHNDVAKTLVEYSANINAQSNAGWTALYFAACYNKQDIVKTLLDFKADINMRNNDGYTPLHVAAIRGNTEVVKALVENGADIHVRNNKGETPLDLAVKNKLDDVVKLLTTNEDK